MSDNTENDVAVDPAEEAAEAAAIAEAMAGYQARAKAPAVEQAAPPAAPAEPVEPEPAPAPAAAAPADKPQPAEVPNLLDDDTAPPAPEPTLAQALADLAELKAAVKSSSGDPDAIRRLHGELGNMNRTLQQLVKNPATASTTPASAPADDELAAAINRAKQVADAYPDIGGPLVEALEATAKRTGPKGMSAEEISALVTQQTQQAAAAAAEQARVQLAQQSLQEEHPDWHVVRETAAFKKWFEAQPEEYRTRVENTWNPAVVAKSLTEFKTELQRQKDQRNQKQNRLAAAVTPPRGDSQQAKPSTIPDERGAEIGYASVKRLNSSTFAKR